MPDAIEAKIAARLQQQRLEDEAGKHAAALALPGPLFDAFAPVQGLTVGKYTVRPVYDLDFEFLQILDHPFKTFALGRTEDVDNFLPRGPHAWVLFYLLTNDIKEVAAAFADPERGPEWVKQQAREEFSLYQLGGLVAIYGKVVQQMIRYAKTTLEFAPELAVGPDDKEASKPNPPSGVPLMASAG